MQHSSRSRARSLFVVATMLVAAACVPDPPSPPDTGGIVRVPSQDVRESGWTFEFYENRDRPWAVSGYQTFMIGTEDGSSATTPRPLWVKMHGGGVGWFTPEGVPMPTTGQKTQEDGAKLSKYVDGGITSLAQRSPEGFRVLVVSMCSHDIYAGTGAADPYNPNPWREGRRTTNGLVSVVEAIHTTEARYPTTGVVLHGGSAGSAGTFNVALKMQQAGEPPAGIIADSGNVNPLWEQASNDQRTECDRGDAGLTLIPMRWDPAFADPGNAPYALISRGDLTVPVMQVYNVADKNTCGNVQIACPLPDGSTPVMNSADCAHRPVRDAILAQNGANHSESFRLCVEGDDDTVPCDRHVLTHLRSNRNSDPAYPADYEPVILDWAVARLAD